MPNCAVIDNQTNQQINFIVAEITDPAPEGCNLIEIPDGYYWNGSDVVLMEVVSGD